MWREDILQGLEKRMVDIQNASLGEHKLRDLNDEINAMIKLVKRWETRIKQLGGKDYKNVGRGLIEKSGLRLPGNEEYFYFGACKDLPKVREIFEKEPEIKPAKDLKALESLITYEYFGFDVDPGLVEV